MITALIVFASQAAALPLGVELQFEETRKYFDRAEDFSLVLSEQTRLQLVQKGSDKKLMWRRFRTPTSEVLDGVSRKFTPQEGTDELYFNSSGLFSNLREPDPVDDVLMARMERIISVALPKDWAAPLNTWKERVEAATEPDVPPLQRLWNAQNDELEFAGRKFRKFKVVGAEVEKEPAMSFSGYVYIELGTGLVGSFKLDIFNAIVPGSEGQLVELAWTRTLKGLKWPK